LCERPNRDTLFVVPAVRPKALLCAISGLMLCVACSSHSKPAACAAQAPGRQVTKACADVYVYLKPNALAAQVDDVGTQLARDPSIRAATYVDPAAVWSDFNSSASIGPEVQGRLTPETTPSVYYVALLRRGEADAVQQRYRTVPGVLDAISRPN